MNRALRDFMEGIENKNRSLRDAREGFDLVRFLNNDKNDARYAEVLKIFELCRQLDELGRNTFHDPSATTAEMWERLRQYTDKRISLVTPLHEALKPYQFTPRVHDLGGSYKTLWEPIAAPGSEPDTIRAASLVQMILDLMEASVLGRIRQCFCGKWFFATTNKKVVCSAICRSQKFRHANKETFNKDRAEYMRDYRRNPMVTKRRKAHGRKKR